MTKRPVLCSEQLPNPFPVLMANLNNETSSCSRWWEITNDNRTSDIIIYYIGTVCSLNKPQCFNFRGQRAATKRRANIFYLVLFRSKCVRVDFKKIAEAQAATKRRQNGCKNVRKVITSVNYLAAIIMIISVLGLQLRNDKRQQTILWI